MSEGWAAIVLQRAEERVGIGEVSFSREVAGSIAIQVVSQGYDRSATINNKVVGNNSVPQSCCATNKIIEATTVESTVAADRTVGQL